MTNEQTLILDYATGQTATENTTCRSCGVSINAGRNYWTGADGRQPVCYVCATREAWAALTVPTVPEHTWKYESQQDDAERIWGRDY